MDFKIPWNAEKQATAQNELIDAQGAVKHKVTTPEEKADARLPLQRDRDRIVWSKSFKRLAHKTQVFPHIYSDHQRQRMSHSLEVMQLASSVARTLGLNSILCEAIALAHDIGHTPFGHAGEEALDATLHGIQMDDITSGVKGLSRFSHYEQGLDVVTYLDSFNPDSMAIGLHLDQSVIEGILKHTHDHSSDSQKYKSLKFLLAETKYKGFNENSGTLESQVVRICDKMSYFMSDLEDGLIIGAIHLEELKKFDLLKPASDVDFKSIINLEDDYRIFRSVRDKILSNLIASLLRQGSNLIGNGNLEIEPEAEIKEQMEIIYRHMERILFQENILIKKANQKAGHIVSCLFCQYLRHPELMPWRFRRRYIVTEENDYFQQLQNHYLGNGSGLTLSDSTGLNLFAWLEERREAGACIPLINKIERRSLADIICVKDYVAGMTDNYAENRYKQDVDCYGSNEAWQKFDMGRSSFIENINF